MSGNQKQRDNTSPAPQSSTAGRNYTVSPSELQALAQKLDEFAQVLSEKERAVLLYMFSEFQKTQMSANPQTTSSLPKLSDVFEEALMPGDASRFQGEAIPVKWTGTISVSGGGGSGGGG